MQTAIVVIIVAGAAFLLARRFYRSVQSQKNLSANCGCSCEGCPPGGSEDCTPSQKQ